jgi:transposase
VCKGNTAGNVCNTGPIQEREILYLFILTIDSKKVIRAKRTIFLARESGMSDEKLVALRHSHTLHPHADQVCDPLFTNGSPFFDPRDLVQVK